jgi:muramidase (phage lysozyme)
MNFIEISDRYAKEILDDQPLTQNQENDLESYMPTSMSEALKQASSPGEAQDWVLATMGALEYFEADPDTEEVVAHAKKKHSWKERIEHWLERWIRHKVEDTAFKIIRETLYNVVRWIYEEAISPIFEYAIDELFVPAFEAITAAVMSPEFLIVAGLGAAAVGLGFLGDWLFHKYFKMGKDYPSGPFPMNGVNNSETIPLPNAPSGAAAPAPSAVASTPTTAPIAQAAAPIAAGEAAVQTAKVAPPPTPTRSSVMGKTFSQLEALIQTGESRRHGYDDYNFSTIGHKHGYAGKAITDMTIAEVQAEQKKHNYNAVGRYQIIASTLQSAIDYLHLDPSAKFDADMQDRIFETYLISNKQKEIGDYIAGRHDDVWAAVYAASKEWASVAAPPGYPLAKGGRGDGLVSYYSGVQDNKASISANSMAETLEAERQSYAQQNGGGSSVQSGVAVPNQQQQSSSSATSKGGYAPYASQAPSQPSSIVRHQGTLLAING